MRDLLAARFLTPIVPAGRRFPDHAIVARGSDVEVVRGDDGR